MTKKPLEALIADLFESYDEESSAIHIYPDPGCLICTAGTTPDRLQTGTCAFHQLRQIAATEEARRKFYAERGVKLL